MTRKIKYIVVTGGGNDAASATTALVGRVSEYINKGYQPVGGVSVVRDISPHTFDQKEYCAAQAMLKLPIATP